MAAEQGSGLLRVLLFCGLFSAFCFGQLCEECTCGVESVVCRNVFILPVLRHSVKFNYKFRQNILDVRHCQGVQDLEADLIEPVFPLLKILFLGHREHCYTTSRTYIVVQTCPGGKLRKKRKKVLLLFALDMGSISNVIVSAFLNISGQDPLLVELKMSHLFNA